MAVHSFFDFNLHILSNLLVFACILGMVAGLSELEDDRAKDTIPKTEYKKARQYAGRQTRGMGVRSIKKDESFDTRLCRGLFSILLLCFMFLPVFRLFSRSVLQNVTPVPEGARKILIQRGAEQIAVFNCRDCLRQENNAAGTLGQVFDA